MTPNEIAKILSSNNIDWAAVTDHNSARNTRVFAEVFSKYGIKTVSGIEVHSREDVHILGYFPSPQIAEEFGFIIEGKLPKVVLDPEKVGYQLIVNEKDEFIGMVESPLSFPSELTIDQIFELIRQFSGIGVFSHIDRSMGILFQLGLIPENLTDVPCEIYSLEKIDSLRPAIKCKNIFSSSDAHNLDSLKKAKMKICCDSRTFSELLQALEGNRGKRIEICR